jgi:hypothetical protein
METLSMSIFGFNDESLDRHGVSHQECLEVLADPTKIEVDEVKVQMDSPGLCGLA